MSFLISLKKNNFIVYSFIVFGVFLLDFSIYSLGVIIGFSIYLANIAAFIIGTTCNILLFRTLLRSKNRYSLSTDLGISFAFYAAILGTGTLLIWLLVEIAGQNIFISKIVSNGITFMINYLARIAFFQDK